MACSCKSGSKAGPTTYTVVLPGGKMKVYSSQTTAEAVAAEIRGAYLLPAAPTGAI